MSVILLRHASAGDRSTWDGDDMLRPLDKRGRKQAAKLRDELRSRGVKRVVSSPYVRCMQTVAPLGLDVVPVLNFHVFAVPAVLGPVDRSLQSNSKFPDAVFDRNLLFEESMAAKRPS